MYTQIGGKWVLILHIVRGVGLHLYYIYFGQYTQSMGSGRLPFAAGEYIILSSLTHFVFWYFTKDHVLIHKENNFPKLASICPNNEDIGSMDGNYNADKLQLRATDLHLSRKKLFLSKPLQQTFSCKSMSWCQLWHETLQISDVDMKPFRLHLHETKSFKARVLPVSTYVENWLRCNIGHEIFEKLAYLEPLSLPHPQTT